MHLLNFKSMPYYIIAAIVYNEQIKQTTDGGRAMMFFGGGMIIFWVIIIGLLIWGGIALAKRGKFTSGTTQKSDPMDMAKERYAKGEISKE